MYNGGKSVLSKPGLLTRPGEYQLVYRKGKRLRGDRFSIIYCANGLAESRLGISIHGIKKAVRRNRIKRVIREFYRLNRHFITTPSDIIFAVRKGFSLDSPQEIKKAVDQLLHHQLSSIP